MVKKLLLIEDDQALGTVTKAGMQAQGMAVSWAKDLDCAREFCREQQYDFAVLDLKLENEVSLQFIPELIDMFPEIKVLMLTGYASIATAVEAVKLGAVNYLPKPANISEILAALNQDGDNTTVDVDDSVMSTKRLEWEHIQRVLAKNNGNVSAAARELNMHRRTLQRKLQKKPVKK